MNKKTLQSLLKDVPSWNEPVNRFARGAFEDELCGRGRGYQYGYDVALQAWCWFLRGWEMYKARVQ